MAVERVSGGSSLIDVLDRVLDKGIVIDAWVRISLVGIDLITVEGGVVVASIDTYLKYADALRWPRQSLQNFTTALWMSEHQMVNILHTTRPALLSKSSLHNKPIYVHPIFYSNRNVCWEADRLRTASCLAVQNFRKEKRIRLEDQVCTTCEMRSYSAVIVVEVPRNADQRAIRELGELVELANRYLSRLFKVEHYYNRMRDMEITIAQMGTVMQSMADPVILTDTQHRVIMQNKAAERFFKMPDEMTEGLVRAVELNNLLFSAALSYR